MKQPLRILLLEDNPLDAELNERTLRKAGLVLQTRRVQHRETLLSALKEFRPDIVLSDFSMPQYDGLRALEDVRRCCPNLPFIFVSGAMGEERAVESLRQGADDYILKGNLARLPSAVEHALAEAERAEALRITEARYHGLFDSMSDGAAIYQAVDDGADFVFLDINPAGQLLSQVHRDQLIGRRVTEIFPGVEAIGLLDVFRRVWKSGEVERHPISLYQDHRLTEWVENTVFRLPTGEVIAVYQDVTERKRIEADLLAEHSRLRTLLDTIPDFVWLKDPEGIYLACNPPFERFFGAKEAEVIGRTDYDFVDAEMADFFRANDRRAVAAGGPSINQEWVTLYEDGRRILLETIKTPMRDADGGLIGVLGIARDITALHEAQAALESHREALEQEVAARTAELRETEAQMRLILNSSADGIFGVDREDRVTFINAAACNLLGYAPEQLVGGPMHETIHRCHTDGSPYPFRECAVYQTLTEGRLLRRDDEFYWHADGHPIPVAYATHPMMRDGAVVGAVVSFQDISTQRAAEAAREEALREAQRLARVRSEFLANMSHEIRTPLNSVLGFAQVGHRDSAGRQAQKTFGLILQSGQILMGILNDILDFSKIEAGKLDIEQEAISLRGLLETTAMMMGRQAEEKGLEFRLRIADDFPASCRGDSLRLRQVLVNLLSNAIKFTERGMVTLSAELEDEALWFKVTDTGIGMDGEHLAKLFQPFEQADGSITRRFGGTGLGLAISKRLAELMGGTIHVESRPGEGSLFALSIPCRGASGRALEEVPPSPPPASRGPRLLGLSILAAEDNRVNRLVLEDLLALEGCRLTLAESGKQAVEEVRDGGPDAFDLVLMDIQMPDLDGYEATRLIHELAPDLPVIGLSAHAITETRELCRAAGMVDHISKPIALDLLVAGILKQVPGAQTTAVNVSTNATPEETCDFNEQADIDWAVLERRYAGRDEFLRRLLNVFHQQNAPTVGALQTAAQEPNLKLVMRIAHNLKGTAGDLLSAPLRRLAGHTEVAARRGEPATGELALELATKLDGLLHQISAYLTDYRSTPGVTAEVMDSAQVEAVLARLEPLVAGDDTAANPLFEQARPLLIPAFGDLARELERRINLFDYPGALQILRQMRRETKNSGENQSPMAGKDQKRRRHGG